MDGTNIVDAATDQCARFDYAALGDNLAGDLRGAAVRIRERMGASVIGVGKDLIVVRDQLDHGDFIAWVEVECGINKRTAQRMMAAAEWANGKSDSVSLLQPTIIYALSSPSTPAPVSDAILARFAEGSHLDAGEVQREIAHAKAAAANQAAKDRRSLSRSAEGRAAAEAATAKEEKRHQREQQKFEREEAVRRANERAALELIVDRLGDCLPDLVNLLGNAEWWRVWEGLKRGENLNGRPVRA